MTKTAAQFDSFLVEGPAFLASALINGDTSSFELQDDHDTLAAFLEELGDDARVVSTEGDPYIGSYVFPTGRLQCTLLQYVVLYPAEPGELPGDLQGKSPEQIAEIRDALKAYDRKVAAEEEARAIAEGEQDAEKLFAPGAGKALDQAVGEVIMHLASPGGWTDDTRLRNVRFRSAVQVEVGQRLANAVGLFNALYDACNSVGVDWNGDLPAVGEEAIIFPMSCDEWLHAVFAFNDYFRALTRGETPAEALVSAYGEPR